MSFILIYGPLALEGTKNAIKYVANAFDRLSIDNKVIVAAFASLALAWLYLSGALAIIYFCVCVVVGASLVMIIASKYFNIRRF